jgi:hypothetical protein
MVENFGKYRENRRFESCYAAEKQIVVVAFINRKGSK